MVRIERTLSRGALLMALVVIPLLVLESAASAQVRAGAVAAPPSSTTHHTLQPIRDSLRTMDYGRIAGQQVAGAAVQPTARKRSVMRRVLGGAIGATGGFFAGGYLGAFIEGDRCNCDDPGLKGAFIGFPVGAVTGGILGAKFF